MPEWGPVLFWPVYLYLVATAAALLSLAARTAGRGGESTLIEARWRALLPVAAVLLLPFWTAIVPHSGIADRALHHLWHRWEAAVHGSAALHALLHFANFGLLLMVGASVVRLVASVARERAFAAEISARGQRAADYPGLPLYRLPSTQPVCFTLGWLRPRIYLSRSLEEHLEGPELAAMLAHEQAHAERRDGLLDGLLRLFYTLLPVPGSKVLLRDWRRAVERACDAAAAEAVGSRMTVARALVQVARLVVRSRQSLPGVAGFTGEEDVEGRVAVLLAPASHPGRPFPLWRWSSAGLLLTGAPLVHHLAELFVHH